jgi:hypothetical protein
VEVTEAQQQIADEIRFAEELYEAGDLEKAHWLAQQSRLKRLLATEPSLTQAQIGEMVGKKQGWVSKVLKWDYSLGNNPFADLKDPSKQGTAPARRTLEKEPMKVAPEIAKALEDPEVRQTVLQHQTAAAVSKMYDDAHQEAYHRQRQKRRDQERQEAAKQGKEPKPTAEELLHGSDPQTLSRELVANTMDQAITRLWSAATKAQHQMMKLGFNLIDVEDEGSFADNRKQLIETGQIVATLMEALDDLEKRATRQVQ